MLPFANKQTPICRTAASTYSRLVRWRNYTHGIRALRLYTYICKGASKRRMLLCSLLDQLFLKNPPASGERCSVHSQSARLFRQSGVRSSKNTPTAAFLTSLHRLPTSLRLAGRQTAIGIPCYARVPKPPHMSLVSD